MHNSKSSAIIDGVLKFQQQLTLCVLIAHALAFLLLVGIIMYEIIIRYFGYSTVLSVEFSGYMMATLVSWSACYSLFEKAHVRIDILYQRQRPIIKSILDAVSMICFASVAIAVAWSAMNLAVDSWEFKDVSSSILRVPLWIPQISWALGFLWLAVCSVTLSLRILLALKPHHREEISLLAGATDETFV
ncbi:TRAP transporter small permease subunit [Pusillimonas sp. ANT_WB101]|uniref:TRAP transporter small permease subunit n=1 Tax=Pusillimonas sp. ANT_WB101 TaxID=2597356 RepID=UPI0011EC9F96|nr:TRAP transporter small permease [Pusillimonas sp. ANT_WB101]KAA0892563.1 TRAP transporter small permease [Pusillimonas sp. ANT_WB101]